MMRFDCGAINISMKNLLPILLIFAGMGCASSSRPSQAESGNFREQAEGYSLLYKLASDESDVAKIFILKHADEPVAAVVKEIATFMQMNKKQLEAFRKSDARLAYDISALPAIELKSRDLQAKDERNGLLFSSGEKFELRLIFTQAEATNYARQLARALAEREDDPTRKQFLTDLAKRSGELHDRLMNLLSVKSSAA
jgi:hypothetical protein